MRYAFISCGDRDQFFCIWRCGEGRCLERRTRPGVLAFLGGVKERGWRRTWQRRWSMHLTAGRAIAGREPCAFWENESWESGRRTGTRFTPGRAASPRYMEWILTVHTRYNIRMFPVDQLSKTSLEVQAKPKNKNNKCALYIQPFLATVAEESPRPPQG